jgi:MerR family transcriptional regulator, light-induced transcriptional regulator
MHNAIPISSVARETGIHKETLRKWEVRYGFPVPLRGERGARSYPAEQIACLVEIKKRIDLGQRPAAIIPSIAAQQTACGRAQTGPAKPPGQATPTDHAIKALQRHDLEEFRQLLERDLASRGVRGFITQTVAELCRAVGQAWADGSVRVFEEHLFAEQLHALLARRSECINLCGGTPRVLLTTLPGEQHTLGLDMVKACFSEAGAYCLNLGGQLPQSEIVAASAALDIDLVALSISAAYPQRQVHPALLQLRRQLPATVAIWAGGQGIEHLDHDPEGIRLFTDIGKATREIEIVRLTLATSVHGYAGQTEHAHV